MQGFALFRCEVVIIYHLKRHIAIWKVGPFV